MELKLVNVTEKEMKLVIESEFKVFRDMFTHQEEWNPKLIPLYVEVRNHLESIMVENFFRIKDVPKKHMYISQKIQDSLRLNSAVRENAAFQKVIDERAKEDRGEGKQEAQTGHTQENVL